MSTKFKWLLVILASLALAIVVVDQTGWLDKLIPTEPRPATTASEADGILEKVFTSVENMMPRLFPGTTELSKAIKNYENASDLSQRIALAYDLVALKFREDLHSSTSTALTPKQEWAYDNAQALLKWAQDILAYEIAKMPDDQLGNQVINFGNHQQTLPPTMAKKILVGKFSRAKEQCDVEDFANLRATFPDEFLAMNLLGSLRVILVLQGEVDRQLMVAVQQPLLASVENPSDRAVIEMIYKIRAFMEDSAKAEKKEDAQSLDAFFESKIKDDVFKVYAYAPGCFKGKGIFAFTKMIHGLQSELRAKFYLDRVRAYAKENHKNPENLNSLRLSDPHDEREEFYSSPLDGWGNSFELKIEGNDVKITSPGPDHQFGTDDDVISAEGDLDETI